MEFGNQKAEKLADFVRAELFDLDFGQHSETTAPGHNFQCKFCHTYFEIEGHLRNHLKESHGRHYFEMCRTCERGFFSVSGFTNHTCLVNPEEMVYCNICNKGFKYKSTLSIHLKSHSKNRNIHCLVCNRAFKHKHCLKVHRCTKS